MTRALCQSSTPFLWLVTSLLIAATFVLTSCTEPSTDKASPTNTPTPTPIPTPTPVTFDAVKLLASSGKRMSQLNSFAFKISHQGGATNLGGDLGLVIEQAVGSIMIPDKLEIQVAGQVRGLVVKLEIITIGGKTYLSDPFSGKWASINTVLNPFNFFDPQQGVLKIMNSVMDPFYSGINQVDGASTHLIEGSLPAKAIASLLGDSVGEGILDVDIWIDSDSFLLRKVELQGLLTSSEQPGILRIIELTSFNSTEDIQPPL